MTESSTTLHEPSDQLTPQAVEMHRGLVSLMEELEAVDWYNQRVDATSDPQLKAILEHNRDEEKEHAMMLLEWLRRRDPSLDTQIRTYLFAEGDIPAAEENAESASDTDTPNDDASLGIGTLKEVEP